MTTLRNPAFIITASLLTSSAALAADDTDQKKGVAVARALAAKARGYGDQSVTISMALKNAHGQEAERKIHVRTLERPGESPYSLIVFDSPRDVKGTALLSRGEDQWLYLPAARRVRRISSSNRSSPFMGSEFSFEDLTGNDPRQHAWKLLGEAACEDGAACLKVEATPKYERSGYSRRVLYVEAEAKRLRRIEFFDRKGEKLKTLTYGEFEAHGAHERAHRWTMVNHQSGKSTVLTFEDFEFDNGYSESDFSKARLKRAR